MKETKKKKPEAGEKEVSPVVTQTGTELGTIQIHENVIASVVRKVVLGIDGVTRLAGSGLVDNIAEFVGRKSHGALIVEMEDGGVSRIEVKVNIKYGAHIPTVASNLQSSIMDEVNKSTGMRVPKVDVIIQEIEEPPKPPVEEPEEEE